MQPSTHDVIIVGSGLIGSATGIALAQAGLSVLLIDSTPTDKRLSTAYDGRTSAVAKGSVGVLTSIGVWNQIEECEPILDIRVCDLNGKFHVHYDHREAGDDPFGYITENRMLRGALYRKADTTPGLTQHHPATVAAITHLPASVAVTLSDGTHWQAPLMLVADGKFSSTREQLGIGHKTLGYGQTAIVCTIAHEQPHHGVAVEKFRPAGPFALLPMTHQRTNIVWAESDAVAARMLELTNTERHAELALRIGDHLGAFEQIGPCHSYPLKLIHAERYIAPRTALIGDAAHAIHPIAGQGANLGYRDVAAICELVIEQARLGLDVGSDALLQRYVNWRRLDTLTMSAATDGLTRLFSNPIPAVRLLRDVGLGMVNEMKPVKHYFMRHAMGMVGNLPKMMRGVAV